MAVSLPSSVSALIADWKTGKDVLRADSLHAAAWPNWPSPLRPYAAMTSRRGGVLSKVPGKRASSPLIFVVVGWRIFSTKK